MVKTSSGMIVVEFARRICFYMTIQNRRITKIKELFDKISELRIRLGGSKRNAAVKSCRVKVIVDYLE